MAVKLSDPQITERVVVEPDDVIPISGGDPADDLQKIRVDQFLDRIPEGATALKLTPAERQKIAAALTDGLGVVAAIDLAIGTAWRLSTGGQGGGTGDGRATWGLIEGLIGDQADLLAALGGKADAGHGHATATTTIAGFLAAGDKLKLNGIQSGAQVNPTGAEIVAALNSTLGGTTWQGGEGGSGAWGSIGGTLSMQTDLQAALDGKAEASHSHANATAGSAGFLSAADKNKLDGIGVGATAAGATGDAFAASHPGDVSAHPALARLASPALTGTPTAPTAAGGTNTTQIATTAYVQTEVTARAPLTHAHAGSAITSGTVAAAYLPAFGTAAAGIVPASGGGSSNFLRADGTWSAPPGGGGVSWGGITGTLADQSDLVAALAGKASSSHNHDGAYQPLDAQLTAVAQLSPSADTLGYFTGSTTATTTPLTAFARLLLDDADAAAARTTIGASASSHNHDAAYAALSHAHAGSAITSGTVAAAYLPAFDTAAAGIVPASGGGSSNFLRADGTWSAPPGGGGGTWGSITGTLSAQTDLANALAGILSGDTGEPISAEASAGSPWTPSVAGSRRVCKAVNGATTINVPGAVGSGAVSKRLELRNTSGSAATLTFSGYTVSGVLPPLTIAAGGTAAFVITTPDGGTTWYLAGDEQIDDWPVKATPVSGDKIRVADSADGWKWKSVALSALPGGGGGAWGSITGTLSAQTDLQNALNAKAPLASPALTGTPTAPTATAGTNSTQIATTQFVQSAVAGVEGGGGSGAVLVFGGDANSVGQVIYGGTASTTLALQTAGGGALAA